MSQIDPDLLKYLMPLRELRSSERKYLASQSKFQNMEINDRIYARDTQDFFLYLIEGKLELFDQGEEAHMISSEDLRAHHPLLSEESLESFIGADTPCKILCIKKTSFYSLIDEEVVISEYAKNDEISFIESSIYNEIIQAVEANELKLPSLPEIALKVRSAIAKEDVGIDDVARIAESDPAIVARLIQVANSPLTRSTEPVNSIRDAIVRMGLSMTQNLIISLSVKQLFDTKQQILKVRMKELYDHSIEIAAISFALSKKLNCFDPDKVLLAGLIHDIGVIPVLAYIDETGLEIQSEKEVDCIVAKLRAAVGLTVVKNWGFPEEMMSVVENAENWFRNSSDELDMTDIILVAQMYNMLQHKQLKGLPDIQKVPVFKKIFPDEADPKFVMEVLSQAQEEINEVKSLIGV
jgi:HD-like signal output (HDOD) protein